MSKCKRCEETQQEINDANNRLAVAEAEHSGLAEWYCAILDENRALWEDYADERARSRKQLRKIEKLKKQLPKEK